MRYLGPTSRKENWGDLVDALQRDPAPLWVSERLEGLARLLDSGRSAALARLHGVDAYEYLATAARQMAARGRLLLAKIPRALPSEYGGLVATTRERLNDAITQFPSVPMIMRHLSPKSLASGRRTEITWLCQSET